jgi:uncharacterized membrane-anchored protein
MMRLEVFDRMDGLVNMATTKKLQQAIASITMALVADGFDDNDIETYINQLTRWTIDEVTDDFV